MLFQFVVESGVVEFFQFVEIDFVVVCFSIKRIIGGLGC
jgi:hypothetical protein